jgi:hypothetical protein
VWSSGPWGAGARAVLQLDGNFVVYRGAAAKWATGTDGFGGAKLALQDDGNLVMYYRGRAIWTWGAGYTGDTLVPGAELPSGAIVRSADGRYVLVMQEEDGNLVLYQGAAPLWGSGPRGRGAHAVMQPDGNFVIYNGAAAPWSTGGAGFPGAVLAVQNDSNIVSYHNGHAIWTRSDGYVGDRLHPGATLLPGAYLKSASKQFMLVMQDTDGNLVLYGSGGPVWGWASNGGPNRRAVMQTDGNFVVYDGPTPIRATGTSGRPGAYIHVQDDSNLVVYQGGVALWDRGRGLLGGGGGSVPGGPDGGYPHAGAADCSRQFGAYSWCIGGNWFSSRGYAYRNCTDWAAWRLQQMGASDGATRGLGHGGQWGARAGAGRTSGTPLRGRAAVKPVSGSDAFGHVAVVEAVHGDGRITVSEYNAAGNGTYRTWTGHPSQRGFSQFVDFGIS